MLEWWRRNVRQRTRAEDPRPEGRASNRLILIVVVTFVWAFCIFLRLVYLQVVRHEDYRKAAERQQLRTLALEAPRGAILDRSGRPLALSVPVDSVCLNPLRIPDRPVAAEILARVLGVNRQELLVRMELAVARYRALGRKAVGTGFVWVKRKITPGESDRLRSLKLDWVEFRKESQRYYPDGSRGGHVVGTVDFQERGNLGLEQALDEVLRGKPGRVRMLTDVQQRGIEARNVDEPEPGASIILTIDERIQFIAERELRAACEHHGAASGSVVVLDPRTGDVLALASYPPFDPNQPPQPGEKKSVRFDHPVSVPFEPGSVFKIITLSAALESTDLRPASLIDCGGGSIRIGNRVIREAKRGYGTLSMAEVLAKSSNVGAIRIGLRVGEEKMKEYVGRFGFGSRTGVPLPGESGGKVRGGQWKLSSIASVSMGHEIMATTMQLAQACSTIANGGLLARPRLVLSRQEPNGQPVAEPLAPARRVLSPSTAVMMQQMMQGVVDFGTGRAARLKGHSAAGKTGSAQIYDHATGHYTHLYNGSFVGFTPVNKPAVVIAVSLNGVKLFGGVVAAPVFQAIATETLRLLDVPRDLPDLEPEPLRNVSEADDLAIAELSEPPDDAPAAPGAGPVSSTPPNVATTAPPPPGPAPDSAERQTLTIALTRPRVPSFEGKSLRAVVEESVALGLPVDVTGSGIARVQAPPAGSLLNPGERVRVHFR